MANRMFQNSIGTFDHGLIFLAGNFTVGAAGAVTNTKGSGFLSVTRLAGGTYIVKLEDPYYRYLAGMTDVLFSPNTGAAINDGSFVVGTTYTITSLGTTNWQTVGLPAGVTPALNQSFVATATNGGGNGTATAVGVSGVATVEVVGDPTTTISAKTPYLMLQCLGATAAGNTTLHAVDPSSGTVIGFAIFVRNSTIKGRGE